MICAGAKKESHLKQGLKIVEEMVTKRNRKAKKGKKE